MSSSATVDGFHARWGLMEIWDAATAGPAVAALQTWTVPLRTTLHVLTDTSSIIGRTACGTDAKHMPRPEPRKTVIIVSVNCLVSASLSAASPVFSNRHP